MRAATCSQRSSISSGVTCALFGWLNTRHTHKHTHRHTHTHTHPHNDTHTQTHTHTHTHRYTNWCTDTMDTHTHTHTHTHTQCHDTHGTHRDVLAAFVDISTVSEYSSAWCDAPLTQPR